MAMKDYVDLFNTAIKRNTKPNVLRRAVRMLDRRSGPSFGAQQFNAIYKVPMQYREKLMKMLFDV